jgi:hypothetical protein
LCGILNIEEFSEKHFEGIIRMNEIIVNKEMNSLLSQPSVYHLVVQNEIDRIIVMEFRNPIKPILRYKIEQINGISEEC